MKNLYSLEQNLKYFIKFCFRMERRDVLRLKLEKKSTHVPTAAHVAAALVSEAPAAPVPGGAPAEFGGPRAPGTTLVREKGTRLLDGSAELVRIGFLGKNGKYQSSVKKWQSFLFCIQAKNLPSYRVPTCLRRT